MRRELTAASQTGVFLAVLLAIQVLGLPNFITGTIVNSIFIFVLLHTGFRHALFLALLSPIGGVMSGHLPAPMYPILPVIICGNFLLVGVYKIFYQYNPFFRLVIPAACKGLLIFGAGYMIIQILSLGEKVKWLVIPVLGIQFFTAIAGLMLGEKFFQIFSRNSGTR